LNLRRIARLLNLTYTAIIDMKEKKYMFGGVFKVEILCKVLWDLFY